MQEWPCTLYVRESFVQPTSPSTSPLSFFFGFSLGVGLLFSILCFCCVDVGCICLFYCLLLFAVLFWSNGWTVMKMYIDKRRDDGNDDGNVDGDDTDVVIWYISLFSFRIANLLFILLLLLLETKLITILNLFNSYRMFSSFCSCLGVCAHVFAQACV